MQTDEENQKVTELEVMTFTWADSDDSMSSNDNDPSSSQVSDYVSTSFRIEDVEVVPLQNTIFDAEHESQSNRNNDLDMKSDRIASGADIKFSIPDTTSDGDAPLFAGFEEVQNKSMVHSTARLEELYANLHLNSQEVHTPQTTALVKRSKGKYVDDELRSTTPSDKEEYCRDSSSQSRSNHSKMNPQLSKLRPRKFKEPAGKYRIEESVCMSFTRGDRLRTLSSSSTDMKKTLETKLRNSKSLINRTPKSRNEKQNIFSRKDCSRKILKRVHFQDLSKHNNIEKRKYICPICKKGFTSSSYVPVHMRIHTQQRPYICGHCNRGFTQKTSLTIHIRRHTGIKPYVCKICKISYSCSVSLKAHLNTHTRENLYSCEICKKVFSSPLYLRRHKTIHITLEKPFQCEICKMKFLINAHLRRHFKTHTTRPYKCQYCLLTFKYLKCLKAHWLTHPNELPFTCNFCGMAFSRDEKLRRHCRVHASEKETKKYLSIDLTEKL